MFKTGTKQGFTLAEVLITLGIIGVVASMTIPTLIQDYNQRAWDTGATVFNRKLGEALKVMNSQSSLAGFTTTKDFVDELSKHIKVVKTCDSNNLTDCFVSEISTTADSIDTSKLKAAKNLYSTTNYGTETIGVLFADGVAALIAYNPMATQDPYSNQIVNVTGSGNTVGLDTDAASILYDVNGLKTPNQMDTGKDIRGLNIAIKTGAEIMMLQNLTSWQNAQSLCQANGMHLPELGAFDSNTKTCSANAANGTLCDISNNKTSYGISSTSRHFWTATNDPNDSNRYFDVTFSNSSVYSRSQIDSAYVLCVSD